MFTPLQIGPSPPPTAAQLPSMLRGNCSSVVLVGVWRKKHPAHRLWKWSHLWEGGVSSASFYFLLMFGSDILALKKWSSPVCCSFESLYGDWGGIHWPWPLMWRRNISLGGGVSWTLVRILPRLLLSIKNKTLYLWSQISSNRRQNPITTDALRWAELHLLCLTVSFPLTCFVL